MLFGKDPKAFFPTAYLKIGKFGKDDADLLFQDVIEGNTFEMADKTIEVLERKYLVKAVSYEGLHRVESAEYPFGALREVLLNAIVHRRYVASPIQVSLYDDKLMVWNEGKLHEELTIEMLKTKHPSLPRNPLLAEICFKGGLIEAWGRGTVRVINECLRLGLPEPNIEIIGGGLVVTMYKDKLNNAYLEKLNLNTRQLSAIQYLKKHKVIKNADYRALFDISEKTALRDLEALVGYELLSKEGEKKGTIYHLNAR